MGFLNDYFKNVKRKLKLYNDKWVLLQREPQPSISNLSGTRGGKGYVVCSIEKDAIYRMDRDRKLSQEIKELNKIIEWTERAIKTFNPYEEDLLYLRFEMGYPLSRLVSEMDMTMTDLKKDIKELEERVETLVNGYKKSEGK